MKKAVNSPKGQSYEAPMAEVVTIGNQSVLCASGGTEPTQNATGSTGGVHFGIDNGSWG